MGGIGMIAAVLASIDPQVTGSAVHSVMSAVTTDSPAVATSISVPLTVEYIAVMVGAMAGAATAFDKKLDIMGAVVLSLATGFGGGLIRDIMLPNASVYMLDNPLAIIMATALGLIAYYFRHLFNKMSMPMFWLDIIAVALFAFLGAEKAIHAGYTPIPCAVLGAITAVGGGFLRDICTGSTPELFKPGNFYGIAAVAGATSYVTLLELHVIKVAAAVVCVVVTIALRYLSIKLNWRTQDPIDYSQQLLKPIKRVLRHPDGSQTVSSGTVDTESLTKPSRLIVVDKKAVLVVHDVVDEEKEGAEKPAAHEGHAAHERRDERSKRDASA